MTCPTFRVLLPALLTLASCVTKTVDGPEPAHPLSRTAIVSSGGATLVPTPASYSWVRSSNVIIDDPRLDAVEARTLIRRALQEALASHGLAPGSRGTAMLQIGYVVAIEKELDESSVSRMFGLDPGLTATDEESAKYDRGTLIVNIAHTGSRTPLWQGSIQVFADLDLPADVRKQRVRRAVELLLARVPFDK